MSAIQFDDSLRTGIDSVDEQHHTLIEIYNELDESFRKGSANRHMDETLARLFKYTKIHFESEEELLERYEYDGLAAHRRQHAKLVEQLQKFIFKYRRGEERISRAMLDFVRDWVTHHIHESDMAFAEPVREAIAKEHQRQPVT